MHYRFFFITILFVQYFIKINTQICSVSPDNTDLLQTGFYSLSNNHNSQRQHCFTILITDFDPSDKNVKAVASTGRINQIQSSTSLGFDYFIRAYSKNNSVQISVFINQDNLWQSMTVSYLISSRLDFNLGYFTSNQISNFGCGSGTNTSNNAISRFIIPDWKSSSSNKYEYIYLISGLQIKGSFKSIGIIQADFNQNNGEIIINIQTISNFSIQYIQISYIMFQSSNLFYAAEYDPFNNINAGDYSIRYYFEGINQFYQNNGIASEGYSFKKNPFLQCIGNNSLCSQNCLSGQNCIKNKGNIFAGKCYICQQNQYFSNGTCIDNSNNCNQNEYFDGSLCVCNVNFVRLNGICQVRCPSLTYYNGSQCICIPGYINFNGACIPQCPANSYLNQFYVCLCNNGYVLNPNGSCVFVGCGLNQAFQSTINSCECINGYLKYNNVCQPQCPNFQNAVIVNGACICIQNFTVFNGYCVPISLVNNKSCTKPHQISVNNSCQCEMNYTYNSTKDCVLACKQNFTSSISGQCVCQTNYIKVGNSCYQICGQTGYRFGTTCLCNSGFRLVNNICVSVCSINQDYNFSLNACQCKTGFGLNNNQACILCPTNSFINYTGYCSCYQNYYASGNACILNVTCQPNSSYNQSLNICVCLPRFNLINGSCQSCPINSAFIGGSCICNSGFYMNGSVCSTCYFSCATCRNGLSSGCLSCINSYMLLNGQCFKLA